LPCESEEDKPAYDTQLKKNTLSDVDEEDELVQLLRRIALNPSLEESEAGFKVLIGPTPECPPSANANSRWPTKRRSLSVSA